ncbi:MAG: hypothetical protein GOVbin4933_20 [Prokaryotic dsDNA virus sp.]|nr:MAG: hypothetical protein GOVbin4933_20 [Prokaryotic dsDNA virus sp.]
MTYHIKEILMEELETVSGALHDLLVNRVIVDNRDDELEHWSGRLTRVNSALHSLGETCHFTQQERNTLLLLVEFHDGFFKPGEEAPFDVLAAESARAKLKG